MKTKSKKPLWQICFEAHHKSARGKDVWKEVEVNETWLKAWQRSANAVAREVRKRQGDGWIKTAERKPTKRDADKCGLVLCWIGRTVVSMGFRSVEKFEIKYWMPCPRPPKGAK